MPLTEHLSELRRRLLVSLIFLAVTFAVTFNYSEEIFGMLTFPLKSELSLTVKSPHFHMTEKSPASLVFLAPAEAFWMHLKVSFAAALVFSLPVIFYQLWRFISPGLLMKEKKYVLPFILSSTLLFVAGAGFCFIIVLPFAM